MERVIIVGLDGATWDIIKPWIDNNELPNLHELIEHGVWAELISTIPPITGPAWASFMTGCNPGKHGIFDFVKLHEGRLRLHKSRDIKSSPIYEILSENGVCNIIIGLPLSFPPSNSFNGIMISDFLYPVKSIVPKSKDKYIKNYKVIPNLQKKGENLLKDMIHTSYIQVQTAKDLFENENWEFFFFLFGLTDAVSHNFWIDITKETPLGEMAKKIFKIADKFLGWVKERMDEKDLLFVISDHGFGPFKFNFNINTYLRNKGYLKTKTSLKREDESIGDLIQEQLKGKPKSRILTKLNIFLKGFINPIKQILKRINIMKNRWIRGLVYTVINTLGLKDIVDKEIIDYDNSLAFMPTPNSMGIKIKKNSGIENELVEILRNLKYRNKNVLKEIFLKSDIYSGKYLDDAPDIILISNDFFISSGLPLDIFSPFYQSAFHKLNGIFIAYGRDIRSGLHLDDMYLYDLAPTILHAFNIAIPSIIDGKVVKMIYNVNSKSAKRPIKYCDEEDKIKKAIKTL